MRLTFLGAAQQVTGSCYLLEAGGMRIVIDCGLFQERAYQERNWDPFPFSADTIDCVLLTHAHLDHAGLLPKLVREGYTGRILATAPTCDLAQIIIADSAKIQEEDADFKMRRHRREGRKPKRPVRPLYTIEDAESVKPLLQPISYDRPIQLGDDVSARYHDAGHILGSASITLEVRENGDTRRIVFSGDIGQRDKPIIRDPVRPVDADYVVMESTYGDRTHERSGEIDDQLCDVINRTVDAGGNIVIPTFAVERAQELLFHLGGLIREDRVPNLLVFLDSPMAVNVTEVFRKHHDCMDEEAWEVLDSGARLFKFPELKLVRSTGDSKAINRIRGSCVILAGSGMCTAGRIKHHLVNNIARPESSVVFVGFQAKGTLGHQIVHGAREVRIHGSSRTVRAKIAQILGLSGHADRTGLIDWLGELKQPPRKVFLTHGEIDAAQALAAGLRERYGFEAHIPAYRETVTLDQ